MKLYTLLFRNLVKTVSNGHGIAQFEGLFCALNEKSQVVKFCLTKTESLRELNTIFQSTKELSNIEMIFTDKCCHDRKCLQDNFDASVLVKLDVWHALDRYVCFSLSSIYPFRYSSFILLQDH